jgi:putative transposase
MMQSVGRMYVRYYNRRYQRSGTLWEGRFKSSLVLRYRYLLELYRYVELNPVRADMVEEPSAYSWYSYSINALGVKSYLQTPHPEYLALGKTKDERYCNSRELFKAHIETEWLKEIRDNINKGLALGNKRFTTQIEALTNRRVTAKKPGRPRKKKDNINNNQLMLL